MSNAMALSIPSAWHSAWVPMTPAAALVLRLPGFVETACRLHDQERPGKAGVADVAIDLADVAAHFRADIGVGHHGGAALELAVLLAELVRRRHEHFWMMLLKHGLCPRLVVSAGIAVEEQDRGRLDAELVQPAAERRHLGDVERPVDVAVGEHALVDFEAQRALDERLMLLEEQVVGIGTIDAANLVDVAEAFGDDERGARAGAFEDGVDGDGRAV